MLACGCSPAHPAGLTLLCAPHALAHMTVAPRTQPLTSPSQSLSRPSKQSPPDSLPAVVWRQSATSACVGLLLPGWHHAWACGMLQDHPAPAMPGTAGATLPALAQRPAARAMTTKPGASGPGLRVAGHTRPAARLAMSVVGALPPQASSAGRRRPPVYLGARER